MKNACSHFWLSFLMVLSYSTQAQNFFESGDWYQLAAVEDGVHTISKSDLEAWGLPSEDPYSVAIYGAGAAMLNQQISETQYTEPQPVKTFVAYSSDSSEYFIHFFAEGSCHRKVINGELETEKNIFSDTSFYYLTFQSNDYSVVFNESIITDTTEGSEVWTQHYYERDEINLLGSGRVWLSDKMSAVGLETNFGFEWANPVGEVSLDYSLVGSSESGSIFGMISVGDSLMEQVYFSRTDAGYGSKGSNRIGSLSFSSDFLFENSFIDIELNNRGYIGANLYVDWLKIDYQVDVSHQLQGNKMYYTLDSAQGVRLNSTGQNYLWCESLDESYTEVVSGVQINSSSESFYTLTTGQYLFYSFDSQAKNKTPIYQYQVDNFDLSVSDDVQLLILYHKSLDSAAQKLLDHKLNMGLNVVTADVDLIAQLYGSGRKDFSAIRNYIHYIYQTSSEFKFVLLLGDCSYDYKAVSGLDHNLIPVYESRQSFHNIQTFSSDDYYGFLNDTDGDWVESSFGNHLLNVSVGRIPASTNEDALNVVDKIIEYESQEDQDNWKNNIVFVADDQDQALHVRQVTELIELIQEASGFMVDKKIYVDAYDRSESSAINADDDLIRAVNEGALVVNFTGHGSEFKWTSEDVLTNQTIKSFSNKGKYPVFVTATCEFGRYDDPSLISGAEALINAEESGAIALVTTTRPVYASSNLKVNKAFYTALFDLEIGEAKYLGDVFKITKNQSIDNVFNRNFSLLGDPSLKLKLPILDIEPLTINEVSVSDFQDTLRLGEPFVIEAQVVDSNLISDYNGVAHLAFYELGEQTQTYGYGGQTTIGYEESKVKFFDTQVSVANGLISTEVILPVELSLATREVFVVIHSYSSSYGEGYATIDNLIVSGMEELLVENTPSEIKLMSDSESIYASNVGLQFQISDDEGLLLSDLILGKQSNVVLDGDVESSLLLSDLLLIDSGTTTQGIVDLSYEGLEQGVHNLEFQVYDAYGDLTILYYEFEVSGSLETTFYPTVFNDNLSLIVNRFDQSGELQIDFYVYNNDGVLVFDGQTTLEDGVLSLEEELGSSLLIELAPGLYHFAVEVRYTETGEYYKELFRLIKE